MGSDGEGVEIVGEDRPSGPDPHSVIAFESGAPQPVAAFEVTDAALDPGPVARAAFAGLAAAGFVAAGDLDPVVGEVWERLAGGAGVGAGERLTPLRRLRFDPTRGCGRRRPG